MKAQAEKVQLVDEGNVNQGIADSAAMILH